MYFLFEPFTDDEKTAYGNILTEEAQMKLALAQSVFESVCDSVLDGSIFIEWLKFIVKDKCCNQFIVLNSQISGKGNVAAGIIQLIAARRNELKAIEEQYILNQCLVDMCRKIDRGE